MTVKHHRAARRKAMNSNIECKLYALYKNLCQYIETKLHADRVQFPTAIGNLVILPHREVARGTAAVTKNVCGAS